MQDFREEDKLGKAYDARLMRRLLTYLRPYRWYVVLSLLLLMLASALQLTRPYLVKLAFDEHIAIGDGPGLNQIALLFLGVLLLEFAMGYGQIYIMEWIGQKAMFDLRGKLFGHIQSMHLGFYDKNPTGRLLTRVTSDVNALNELFASGVVDIVGNLIMIGGILIVMFSLSVKLSLVTFIIIPLILVATIMFRVKVRDSYREIRIQLAKLNAFTQEHLAGMTEVQNFVQEDKTMKRYAKINGELMDQHKRSVLLYAVFFPVVEIIGAISTALIVWYGGGQVVQQAISFGTLVAFFQYVDMFYRPIRDLAEKYNILQAAMAASERIFNILDTSPAITAPTAAHRLDGYDGTIKFDRVNFAYNADHPVLNDVSFEIGSGEKVALVGATGSGKTTTVSLMCRLYDVNSGAIMLNGAEIRQLDPREVRAQVGLVLQDVFLFSGSIQDNITLGNEQISDEQVRAAAERVGLLPFVNRLEHGFAHKVGERGSSLSVGQRQLISFARALAYNPRVLILDEATSSVDNETENIIQQAIHRLFEGRTSVVVAHRLSTIREADKILVFHKGRIVEQGRHEELLKQHGVYWRLYQLQYQDQEATRGV
ncbi:MAG: ABC transporter ATP-binding protein [candidate division Zixibacteria bacterium]|nr:ABC transporter ATP-binding protein [candidate division Zixibacteria bacterium]